ncbi:MAG: branched-chain amino acid ABC transporter permease, partial [Kiritimatiellae bacterium]|nr:branched-chain amino acid ABC transporter permease [Kiritimatiellia bacterium]
MIYLEQLINALIVGSVYALMALGLSLIFGVLRLVNFAHAQAIMVGGFFYFYLATLADLQSSVWFFAALLATIPFLFGFGVLLERGFLRPAYQEKVARFEEYVILITFALGLFLQNIALPLFGPYHRQPPAIFKGRVTFGELVISGDRLTASCMSVVIIIALLLFLYRTFPGKGLRAVAQSPEAAAISGVNVPRTRTLAFGLGITLTGLAGGLLGPVFLVGPTMGATFAIKAFVIVVLGGMGSIGGSIIGAFLLALVESFAMVLIPDISRAMAYKD